jgi:RNA methyltransferase, TrmH family
VLSKNRIKFIKSLEFRKFRQMHRLFVAEGNKTVTDLLISGFPVNLLIGTPGFIQDNSSLIHEDVEIAEATQDEIKNASFLRQPQQVIALCKIPEDPQEMPDPAKQLVICLDNIQDPGNLGTIIRIADWFGIGSIVCSPDTADVYNPKSIQSTMGSIGRVSVIYHPLPSYLMGLQHKGISVTGTFLDGENIYQTTLPESGVLIMGNEGRGVSPETGAFITSRVHIPTFALPGHHAESLNVAIATAIVCSEFRRRQG